MGPPYKTRIKVENRIQELCRSEKVQDLETRGRLRRHLDVD